MIDVSVLLAQEISGAMREEMFGDDGGAGGEGGGFFH